MFSRFRKRGKRRAGSHESVKFHLDFQRLLGGVYAETQGLARRGRGTAGTFALKITGDISDAVIRVV